MVLHTLRFEVVGDVESIVFNFSCSVWLVYMVVQAKEKGLL